MSRAAAHARAGLLPDHVAAVLSRPGRPLDAATRAAMERRFNQPLGEVRLHTDAAAAQSASALSAQAYALGHHIVFGPAGYAPDQPASRRRLAHELAHVVQQRGGGADLPHAQRESEARQAARSVDAGAPMPRLSAATPALSCDDGAEGQAATAPGPATVEDAASAAVARCDIGALCRLRRQAPDVVSSARLMAVYRSCHPSVPLAGLLGGDPCLTPNFGLPYGPGAAGLPAGPLASPGAGGAGAGGGTGSTGSGSAGSGALALPSTTVRFNLGPAAFTVDLPTSIAVNLPVAFRGAQRLAFTLNASTTEFSLTVTVNAVPHVRIIARAGMTYEGRGSAALTIQTTRTTCNAVNAAEARSALEAAGTRLRDAIQAVQTAAPPGPDASALERDFALQSRLGAVVGAVVKLKSEIDRVSAPCREVPVASLELGAQGPLSTPEPATPGATAAPPPASFLGGSLRLHF